MNKKLSISIIVLLVLSVGVNVWVLNTWKRPQRAVSVADIDGTITTIERYLDSISTDYVADARALASEHNVPSWGCGPTSYALAHIINEKFLDGAFPIKAAYDRNQPYQIVERFGLATHNGETGDHNWLEIYFQDKMLFIDPTNGQFGGDPKIVYQVFTVGDPKLGKTLQDKYHIVDVRLSLLVPKVVNRISVNQDPYPGLTIESDDLDYYLKALDVRNEVNDGIDPPEWKEWTDYLIGKYIHMEK